MPFAVSLAFGILGVIGVIAVVANLLGYMRERQIDSNFILALATVLLANGTALVSQFSGGRTLVVTGEDTFVAVLSPAAREFSAFTLPLMALIAVAYVVLQTRRGLNVNGPAVIFLLLLIFSGLASVLNGGDFINIARLTLLLPILALAVSKPSAGALRGAAVGLGLLVSLSGILTLVAPEQANAVCDTRKCGAFGTLFNGVAFNFNGFGLLVALSIPFLYFGLRRFRAYFLVFAMVAVFASGSRTAQFAAAVAVFIIALYAQWRFRAPKLFAGVVVTTCIVSLAFVVLLPFIGLDPAEFTGRAGLWQLALSSVQSSWLFGLGPDTWAKQVNDGVISYVSSYSTHNQLVEIIYVSGVVGVVLFSAAMIGLLWRVRKNYVEFLVLIIPALIVGSTERPWTLGIADWLSWSIIILLMLTFAPRPSMNTNESTQTEFEVSRPLDSPNFFSPVGK